MSIREWEPDLWNTRQPLKPTASQTLLRAAVRIPSFEFLHCRKVNREVGNVRLVKKSDKLNRNAGIFWANGANYFSSHWHQFLSPVFFKNLMKHKTCFKAQFWNSVSESNHGRGSTVSKRTEIWVPCWRCNFTDVGSSPGGRKKQS